MRDLQQKALESIMKCIDTSKNFDSPFNRNLLDSINEESVESLGKKILEGKGQGLRHNVGKVRYDLLEPYAIEQLAMVFTKGANKYAPNNWLKGMDWSKMRASLGRHLAAYDRGEDYDFDPTCKDCNNGNCTNHTGLLHIAQVAWNAMAILSYYKHYPEGDDRYQKPRRKIGLDIDEVICDWINPWCEKFNLKRPTSWFFQRDIINKFDEMTKTGELAEFYMNLPPLMKPMDIPFEPHCYVTSRPVPTEVTEKWLDLHGFPARPVITVAPGKGKVEALKKAGVEVFVDDRFENFEELNREGILCYLWDSPHNHRYQVGYKRIKSLKELL